MYPAAGMFLQWYYAQRSHLFSCFQRGNHSGLNVAQVGSAKWKPKHKLSLVKVARDDVTTMITQEAELKFNFLSQLRFFRCNDGKVGKSKGNRSR